MQVAKTHFYISVKFIIATGKQGSTLLLWDSYFRVPGCCGLSFTTPFILATHPAAAGFYFSKMLNRQDCFIPARQTRYTRTNVISVSTARYPTGI